MAKKSNFVNLDAMVKREDFSKESANVSSFETFNNIPARDLENGRPIVTFLRKPDFQRETNHWAPEQVASLLKCYLDGDLIPSVILWKSDTYMFVIDGGHRLSVLRAWVEDDYGDDHLSLKYFGKDIPKEQVKAAQDTRRLINETIGSWESYQKLLKLDDQEGIDPIRKKRLSNLTTRGLSVQWVSGNIDKAEESFFNINMKGTPLDELEENLLRNRMNPIAISARAIIRAGKGNKYWSSFGEKIKENVELEALKLHKILFDPEISAPIKTLDLPLSGSKGVRSALQILIDLLLLSNLKIDNKNKKITDYKYDEQIIGETTVQCLKKLFNLMSRITGNDRGSLGLHPAIYFYGPTGRHSIPMFLGTCTLLQEKLSNNDSLFFLKFTEIREKLEKILIENKDLIAGILQRSISTRRVDVYKNLLSNTIKALLENKEISEQDLIVFSGFQGKILAGEYISSSEKFSDDHKSKVYIYSALESALKCPECRGYLDSTKSMSYDHKQRVREGGLGTSDNCQLMHPICNQAIKN